MQVKADVECEFHKITHVSACGSASLLLVSSVVAEPVCGSSCRR